jgi:hypothetical protein
MGDKLKECALAFRELLDKEYHIKAGKKGKLIEVRIFFDKEHFHHLIGLHKLSDLRQIKRSNTEAFDDIINDKLTYEEIASSEFFNEMSDRLEYFPFLEQMLDSEEAMIKYNKSQAKSSIEAEYIIYSKIDDLYVHFFIDIDEKQQKYFGRTFFTRSDSLYLYDRPYKILEKTKIIKTIE